MTHNNNRNSNAKIRYFNVHTEALGYLNGLREIAPQSGQQFEPFWVTTFCMLEGDPQNPTKKYININIVNKNLVDVLLNFEGEINSDQVSVFANARLASLDAEPFVFGQNSKTPGALGINWSGKMISLNYLKVGDEVIDLGLDKAPTTDFGVSADDQSQQFSSNQNVRQPRNNQYQNNPSQGRRGNANQGNFRKNQGSSNFSGRQGSHTAQGTSNRQAYSPSSQR